MKKLFLILIILSIGASWVWWNYIQEPIATPTQTPLLTSPPIPSSTVTFTIEMVATYLEVPWSIIFTDKSRMLVTERKGTVREIKNGVLTNNPLLTVPDVSSKSEEGLMGMAKDPEYDTNFYLYICLAYPKRSELVNKVVRLIDMNDTIRIDTTIIDDIPSARFHAGCRLGFGPDNKLYITTGDATDKDIAQDIQSLGGKILRINPDGSLPEDNPFPNSPVYSLGHRNPQGLAWHPVTNDLYSTEHGPSTVDGPPGGDELNRIQKGGNYGWPVVSHERSKTGFMNPLIVYTPATAPASALIYSGNIFPQFKHNLFFGGLIGTGLYRIVLDEQHTDRVLFQEKLKQIDVGRIRDVVEGPDGYIYFSTSNRDGRGKPNLTDDAIYRLIPSQ